MRIPRATYLMIFCRSEKAALRTLEHILPYIEGRLFLRVNREKTQVAHVSRVKYLGHGFYIHKGEGRLRVHQKSIRKLQDSIREATSRSNGMGTEERKTQLQQEVRGWVNYFKLADIRQLMQRLDEWLRSRIRMVVWKRWKRVRTRLANLRKLGVPAKQAWMWANTRRGYWRTAHSPILTRALSSERIKRAGYPSFVEYYAKR